MTAPKFTDRSHPPTEAELASGLGDAASHWAGLVAHVVATAGAVPEWKFYGAKHGWQLKLMSGRRALVYLIPRDGCFTAGLALDPAAVDALGSAGLPAELVREIREAKTYPEGRPARVVVRGSEDVAVAERLVALKAARRGSAAPR